MFTFLCVCVFRAYRCPLCMQSALNMEQYWEERDVEIAQSPMPPVFKNQKVKVLVNCSAGAPFW